VEDAAPRTGAGFTHTKFFWAHPPEQPAEVYPGGIEGLELAQELRMVGDAHRKRGEWKEAEAAYDLGTEALFLPHEDAIDRIYSAIDEDGEGMASHAKIAAFLGRRGVPEPAADAEATTLLEQVPYAEQSGALTRAEFKQMGAQYYKEHPEKLDPLIKLGGERWPDLPHIKALKGELKFVDDGSTRQTELQLELKGALVAGEPTIKYDFDYASNGKFPVPQEDNPWTHELNPDKSIGNHSGVWFEPNPIAENADPEKEAIPKVLFCNDKRPEGYHSGTANLFWDEASTVKIPEGGEENSRGDEAVDSFNDPST